MPWRASAIGVNCGRRDRKQRRQPVAEVTLFEATGFAGEMTDRAAPNTFPDGLPIDP